MTRNPETTRIALLAAAGALVLAASSLAQSEEDYEVGVIPDTYARPAYPDGVTQNGACVAFFEVQPDGAVAMGSLSVSCTPQLFKTSVEDAMRQWRFEPTIVDGVAVGATGYSARIRFTDGHCVRVSSGNAVDRACALTEE